MLVFIPVLWLLAIVNEPVWLGAVPSAAITTDALDGYLASTWNQVTALGTQLDSIANAALLSSVIDWLLMLRPEVALGRLGFVLSVAIGIWLTAFTIGWVRFRRFANLHLYSCKVTAVAESAFLVRFFISGFEPWHFYLAAVSSSPWTRSAALSATWPDVS